MMKASWESSASRLDLGTRNLGRMEYLLGAALGIIIVGSLIMSIYVMFRGGNQPLTPGTRYKCEKCGHEWDFDIQKEMAAANQDPRGPRGPMMMEQMGPMGPQAKDCPQCKAKLSCWLMNRCVNPKCGKYWEKTPQERDPRIGAISRVCPHCKTDQIQWLRDNLK